MSLDPQSNRQPHTHKERGFFASLLFAFLDGIIKFVVAFAVGTGAGALVCWYYGLPLVLSLVVFARRLPFPRSPRIWLGFLAMAIAGNSLPFFLISWGQQTIDSGVAGMIMAIMPLMTMILRRILSFIDDAAAGPAGVGKY